MQLMIIIPKPWKALMKPLSEPYILYPAQLVTLVGTSMGASIIWSYVELFGDARVSKAVFVDQAPLQVCVPPLHAIQSVLAKTLRNFRDQMVVRLQIIRSILSHPEKYVEYKLGSPVILPIDVYILLRVIWVANICNKAVE